MRQVTDTTYRRAICTTMPNGKLLGSDQREIYGYCKRTVARFARMQHPGRATARNTAPCIAYACWKIKKQHPQANIVVTPSDALVINTGEFQRVMRCALDFTDTNSSIVTIGIKPSRPETGYGYIQAAEQINGTEIYKVDAFKEKPDVETAKEYVAHGSYFWNAGILCGT